MNRNRARAYIANAKWIKGFSEGREIQGTNDIPRGWMDLESPSFLQHPDHYRFKPEPEEFWVSKYINGEVFINSSEDNARLAATGNEANYEYIAKRFVEPEQ